MQTRLHDPLSRASVLQKLIKGLQEDSASIAGSLQLPLGLFKAPLLGFNPLAGRPTLEMDSI